MFSPIIYLALRRFVKFTTHYMNTPWFRMGTVLLLTSLGLPVPRGQAINISYSYDERAEPAFDPDGLELRRITNAAIAIWESYILDDVDYHFDLSWGNLDGGTFGQHEDFLGWATNNIIIDTRGPDGVDRNWFFDPTPFSNEEFVMRDTLVRDESAADIDAGFSGNPHEVLEIGFGGFARSGSAATGKLDLLSIVTHELGHHLGLSYNGLFEDYYDFNSATVGGRSVGVLQTGDYEINLDSVLMTDWPSNSGGERRLPSATDILATWDESVHVTYVNGQQVYKRFEQFNLPRVDFIGEQSNSWHQTLNWIGGKIPDVDNEVNIRHGGNVFQTTGNSSAKVLNINDGSKLFVQGSRLTVLGNTELGLSGAQRSEIQVGNFNDTFSTFQTNNLTLVAGLVNLFNSKASVDVDRDFRIQGNSALMGAGAVRVGGKLINDGEINGGTFLLFGFGGKLTLGTSGLGAKLDLDGQGERGVITANLGDLSVYGPLADDFNGTAAVAETRTMRFSQPWKMKGQMYLRGGSSEALWATLSGGEVTVGGNVEVDGKARILAPVIFNSPAVVNLPDADDLLLLGSTTTFSGGTFTGNGTLAIAGNASTAIPNPIVGDFPDEATQFMALSFVVPDIQVQGEFEILDPTPTDSIPNPGTSFPGGFSTYGFNVPVQVRTGGTLTASISSAFLPKLLTMSGGRITGTSTVNLVGDLIVDQNSIINPNTFLWGVDATNHHTTIRSGKRLDLVTNRIVRTDANQQYRGQIVLEAGAALNVDLGVADSWNLAGELLMNLGSSVAGEDILNTGTVRGNGSFLIDRFENAGRLVPGRVFGGIQMTGTQFVQTPAGILDIVLGTSLGGNSSGLLSTATAQLGGTLALSLVSNFNPAVGTEIDILTANAISGQFANVTLTAPFGSTLAGDVLYRSNRVTFRVTQFATNPALAADFNRDGVVNDQDLVYWQKAYGQVTGRSSSSGDADGDGDTDGRDLLLWQRRAASVPTKGTRTLFGAVPEPSTLLLGLMAMLGMSFRKVR